MLSEYLRPSIEPCTCGYIIHPICPPSHIKYLMDSQRYNNDLSSGVNVGLSVLIICEMRGGLSERSRSDINPRPPRIRRPRRPVPPPITCHQHRADQPQEGIRQIDPHCVLHALYAGVAFGVFFDVHLFRVLRQPCSVSSLWGLRQDGKGERGGGPGGAKRGGGELTALTFPKIPNSTIHRKKRTQSQIKTSGTRIINGIMYNTAVKADKPPTTSA